MAKPPSVVHLPRVRRALDARARREGRPAPRSSPAARGTVLLPDEVIVIFVRADPVPDCDIALRSLVDEVDGPIAACHRDGSAALLVSAAVRVVKIVILKDGVVGVLLKELECLLRELLDLAGKPVEKLLELSCANAPDR
jgi:hypothetical protein